MPMIFAAFALLSTTGAGEEGRRGIAAQVAAWNRGDLEGALSHYCSSEIAWVNRSGLSRGFAEFAAGMRQDFADPARMGRYEAEVLEARDAGEGALIVVRWSISRDGARLMGGVSTQLWARCDGRRRIVLEHAS